MQSARCCVYIIECVFDFLIRREIYEQRDNEQVLRAYDDAKKTFAAYGVDTDKAIAEFEQIPISLHNWQGDDVMGFEKIPTRFRRIW